jgi:hypothetical protein
MAIDGDERRLYAGSSDALLRVWNIESLYNREAKAGAAVNDGAVAVAEEAAREEAAGDATTRALVTAAEQATAAAGAAGEVAVTYYGAVQRRSDAPRVVHLSFARHDPSLLCCVAASSKLLELYQVFDERGITKRRRRRRQRARQRRSEPLDEDDPSLVDPLAPAPTVASDEVRIVIVRRCASAHSIIIIVLQ